MTADAYRAPLTSARPIDLGVVEIRAAENERDDALREQFCAVPDKSFVWSRLDDGFHLGRLTGPCRGNTRPCDWLPDPVDPALVPEQVSYALSRGGRNFQRIGLAGAGDATARVWDHYQA